LLHDGVTQGAYQAKTPSTPEDQSIGLAAGVKPICEKAGISPSDISLVLHGATVAANAVLEGKGARVGLLVTAAFEYTLHLAKSWTPVRCLDGSSWTSRSRSPRCATRAAFLNA
jgi:N-methylhydantoinase A